MVSRQRILRAGTRFVSDHQVLGPVLFGTGAGVALLLPFGVASWSKNAAIGTVASLTLIAVFVSTAALGSIVRRGGSGRTGLLLTVAGMVTPLVLAIGAFAQNPPPDAGCPSCVAESLLFLVPGLLAMLLTPMAIGYKRARSAITEGPAA